MPAAPNKTAATATQRAQPSELIIAGPLLLLAERWRAELSTLRKRAPGSDAVQSMADCIDELEAAYRAARETQTELTLSEAHSASGVPVSTLRWLCSNKPDEIGATKERGVWYVRRHQFDHWRTVGRRVSAERTSDDQPPATPELEVAA